MFSIDGAIPTRINTWGIPSRSVSCRMMSRLVASSVMCVIVQVAKPVAVQSSRTVDSTCPQLRASCRVSSGVDSTRMLDSSTGVAVRRSP